MRWIAIVILAACGGRAQPPTYTPLGESHAPGPKLAETTAPPDAGEVQGRALSSGAIGNGPAPLPAAPAPAPAPDAQPNVNSPPPPPPPP